MTKLADDRVLLAFLLIVSLCATGCPGASATYYGPVPDSSGEGSLFPDGSPPAGDGPAVAGDGPGVASDGPAVVGDKGPDKSPKVDVGVASCGPSNCSGCCAGTTCVTVLTDTQCGTSGAVCQSCTANSKVCSSGACKCASPITTDPTGCVKATCSGWPSPQVHLTWCSHPSQTVNSVQRGLGLVTDAGFSWAFVYGTTDLTVKSWTDTTVSAGSTYTYRIKFDPNIASNNVVVPVNACNCQ